MNKKEFLDKLREGGGDDALIVYYDELISDKVENGEEESAVIESYDVRRVLRDAEFEQAKKQLEEQTKGRKKLKGWVVILALCSTPVTVPLAIAFGAIVLSLVAVVFAFLIAAVAGIFWLAASAGELIAINDSAASVILHIGAGLVSLGAVGLLGYYGAKVLRRCYNWISVKFFSKVRAKA